jgi:general secretion pathway protein F
MPGFRYQAYNVEGRLHKGVLEADSARQARATLRDQGLTPHRVELIAANDPAGGARFGRISLSTSELTQLTRGLASLLEAGLTVDRHSTRSSSRPSASGCARCSRRCAAR